MKITDLVAALAVTALAGAFNPFASAQAAAPAEAHNVVLVHGAWADGSSWAEVIPYLQAAGMKVTAFAMPLMAVLNPAQHREHYFVEAPETVLIFSGVIGHI